MHAYVSLLLNSDYLPGTLALRQSLIQTGSRVPFVLLCSRQKLGSGIFRQLADLFDEVIDIDPHLLESKDRHQLVDLLARPDLALTLSKLNCWTLTKFDTVVYLDADTLVLRNIDSLFELSFPANGVAASPDAGWPDCFNSGLLVLHPSADTYADLAAFAASHPSFDGADQGILNEYFHDHWTLLPFTDNCTASSGYQYLPALVRFQENVRVVHFIGLHKPWTDRQRSLDPTLFKLDYNGAHKNLQQIWWDLYEAADKGKYGSAEVLELAGVLQPSTLLKTHSAKCEENATTHSTPSKSPHTDSPGNPSRAVHRAVQLKAEPGTGPEAEEVSPIVFQPRGPEPVHDFPTFYYKPDLHRQPLVDQSEHGEAWRLAEPRFNFPEDELRGVSRVEFKGVEEVEEIQGTEEIQETQETQGVEEIQVIQETPPENPFWSHAPQHAPHTAPHEESYSTGNFESVQSVQQSQPQRTQQSYDQPSHWSAPQSTGHLPPVTPSPQWRETSPQWREEPKWAHEESSETSSEIPTPSETQSAGSPEFRDKSKSPSTPEVLSPESPSTPPMSIEEYIKAHPVFPWETALGSLGSPTERVFFNSPDYKPPGYSISLFQRNGPIRGEQGQLIGFNDGEELARYLAAIESLPSYRGEERDRLERKKREEEQRKREEEKREKEEEELETSSTSSFDDSVWNENKSEEPEEPRSPSMTPALEPHPLNALYRSIEESIFLTVHEAVIKALQDAGQDTSPQSLTKRAIEGAIAALSARL